MEEGLRAAGVAAVVGEVGALPAVASRRLQLAAERSGVTAFMLRRWRDGGQAARERNLPNAAATRWRIAALPSRPIPIPSYPTSPRSFPSSPHAGENGWGLREKRRENEGEEPGIGHPRWRVELLRCRGGAPAGWEVEIREGKMADATDIVSLAAALADRPAAPLGGDASPPERSAAPAEEGAFATVVDAAGRRLLAAVNPAAAGPGWRRECRWRTRCPLCPVSPPPRPSPQRMPRHCAGWRNGAAATARGPHPTGSDGIKIEITGCAHLWGGEGALMADLAARLARQSVAGRIAIADTLGAAWAFARFAEAGRAP